MLVAQCAGGAPCDLPTGLPWYFGAVVAVVWLAVVVGAVLLGRHLLRERWRGRRRSAPSRAIEAPAPGTDVEHW